MGKNRPSLKPLKCRVGVGGWGFGIRDWVVLIHPIPNPQPLIPNPQSQNPNAKLESTPPTESQPAVGLCGRCGPGRHCRDVGGFCQQRGWLFGAGDRCHGAARQHFGGRGRGRRVADRGNPVQSAHRHRVEPGRDAGGHCGGLAGGAQRAAAHPGRWPGGGAQRTREPHPHRPRDPRPGRHQSQRRLRSRGRPRLGAGGSGRGSDRLLFGATPGAQSPGGDLQREAVAADLGHHPRRHPHSQRHFALWAESPGLFAPQPLRLCQLQARAGGRCKIRGHQLWPAGRDRRPLGQDHRAHV